MGCSNSHSQTPVCANDEIVAQDFHDKYLLGIKLGRGAFAQVRACTKISSGPVNPTAESPPKERAVKILDMRDTDKPGEVCAQLQKAAHKEATVWKTVGHHPNCVRLHDLFFGADFCYMVMEKCSSGLLQALEDVPELTERGLGNVFAQMLIGIAHCHSVKVVHRDIKPDNFLVGGEDGQTVKLADFGLSAALPKQGKLPGVFGTAPFMCPEMLLGRWYDEKADVWSFGVVCYVLMFGLFPYMPKQQSAKCMKQTIIDGAVPPSFEPFLQKSAVPPSTLYRSPDAVSMIKMLLSRDPEERPSTEEALNMNWMKSALQGSHMPGMDLPSLRPMLHSAKKVGAFEVRDPARVTNVDVLLNNLQMQRHVEPLPQTPTLIGGRSSPQEQRDRTSLKGKNLEKPRDREGQSSRSTTCDGSHSIDGSSDRSGFHHGSGWSKGTFQTAFSGMEPSSHTSGMSR